MLSHKKSLNILKKTNALLDGHFVLSSGLHSSKYIQCAKLLSYPNLAKHRVWQLINWQLIMRRKPANLKSAGGMGLAINELAIIELKQCSSVAFV